jgi:hypothetical protein
MTVQFVNVSSGAGATGISLTNALGTFNATGGTLSGHTTSEVGISGGTGAITYGGVIGDGTGLSASIASRTGGTVTLSGNINDGVDVGGGISVSSNTGGTIDFTGTTKTLNTVTGNAVSMTNNTGTTTNFTNGGLDIDTTSGTGFSASVAGTYSVTGSGNTINTTSGTALNLAFVTVGANGITFNSATTTSAATGISIDTVDQAAGSTGIDINGGSIAGATSRGVDINTTAADISIASSIASTAAGRSVEVTNSGKAGGSTINFTGAITDPGLGINLDNNDQGGIATINFSGGLNIDSTTHTGFNATNGGTVNVTQNNTSIVNTIDTTTGTALNVANTTIGASDLTFRSIASNGAADGIVLNTTGSTGGLTVTGNGGTVTNAATATGGAIQNSTGAGISLTGVGGGVSLTRMYVGDGDSTGILGTNVTGLTLANSLIANNGDAAGEHGVFITGLFGNSSVTNTTFTHNAESQFKVSNTTATVAQGSVAGDILTMSGITMNGQSGGFVGDSLQINSDQTANFHLIIDNSSGNNTITGGIDGILVNASSGGDADVDISNVTVTNTSGPGINFNPVSTGSRVWFDVHNNTITTPGSTGINATAIGNDAGIEGFINNNTITQGATGNGITIITEGDGDNTTRPTATISATNNTITGVVNGSGINVQARVGGIINLTLDNNHININDPLNLEGIHVQAGSSSPADNTASMTNIVRLNMHNNDVTVGAASGQEDYRLTVRGVNTFQLQDFVGNGANAADVATWITSTKANTKFDGVSTPTTQVSMLTGGVFSASAGAIPTPSLPTPLLSAPGGVQASSPTPGETHLDQTQLNSAVAAALALWAAAGLSSDKIAELQHVIYDVGDIKPGWLGQSTPGHVTIDVNADGYGWFVDTTPLDNSEFAHVASASDLMTDPSTAAAGHMDLLTTVVHEMGEQLGLEDSFAATDQGHISYAHLMTGERVLATASDVAQVNAVDVATIESSLPSSAQAASGTPIVVGTAANDTIDAGHGGTILFGGAGADNFVFGPGIQLNAPTPAQITHVADYSAAQGDTFDFSALTSTFHNSGVSDALVVRAVEDASGKFAMLQVDHIDPMGLPSAPNWVNVAQLDGAHAGDSVNVLIDNNHSVHLAQIHVDLLV